MERMAESAPDSGAEAAKAGVRAEAAREGTKAGGGHAGAALVVILAMTFMEILDGTIVNVALPSMQQELGVDMASIQWVASIYSIVTCAALLVFGRLGDMFGKVCIFQVGALRAFGNVRDACRCSRRPVAWRRGFAC